MHQKCKKSVASLGTLKSYDKWLLIYLITQPFNKIGGTANSYIIWKMNTNTFY